MSEIFIQLLPILVYFGVGVLLRRTSLAQKTHGDFLVRVVLHVSLPLLIIITLSKADITANMVSLPFASIGVSLACMLMSLVGIKIFKIERKAAGSILVSSMMMNNLFMLPYILTVYGESGFVDAILFNVGNIVLIGTYVYVLAHKYNGQDHQNSELLGNILKLPLMWAVLIGLGLSAAGISLPQQIERIALPLAELISPLIMLAMGILVSFDFTKIKFPLIAVFVRMVMGALFGFAIAAYLGLESSSFIVVALCSAAPVGMNSMAYLTRVKLDAELRERSVSISILLGLIYMPLMIALLS